MEDLKGKTFIVTGGAAGIGKGITTHLVKQGANVVAVDINGDAGFELEQKHTGQIAFLKGDVSKEATAKEALNLAIEKFEGLDGVVNNAHASRQKPLLDLTTEDWELSFNTGFRATLYFMKAAHEELAKSKGAIVNFGSGAALDGQATQASYAAAKEAIRGLSRVAANEWAKDGIRVNVVCPLALTEGVAMWKEKHPQQYEQVEKGIPLHRFGDPEKDIAPVVAFLLSKNSQYMTGQTLMADGGSKKLR